MAQTSLLLLLGSPASATAAEAPSIEQAGMLIPDSSLLGDRRADDTERRRRWPMWPILHLPRRGRSFVWCSLILLFGLV